MTSKASPKKKINLALQGGGAHGAFTWGVVDRLLEDNRIEFEGVTGTSAGAMNATVIAYGLTVGGPELARSKLAEFWKKTSDAGRFGPMQPSLLDKMFGKGDLEFSPMYHLTDAISRLFSPYQLNPFNINPLRDVLNDVVDFKILHKRDKIKLYLSATNVCTGRLKVFSGSEICIDAVMASACLPFMFQTVEVNGEYFWDGGYMGNPPLYPLIYDCESPDVLIVQINPVNISEPPKTAGAIFDRVNTLSFNSSMMRELRVVHFINRLVEAGYTDDGKLRKTLIHTIDAEETMQGLSVSSKLNPDWDHLQDLFKLGRQKGEEFLKDHFDDLGQRSSTDVQTKFM